MQYITPRRTGMRSQFREGSFTSLFSVLGAEHNEKATICKDQFDRWMEEKVWTRGDSAGGRSMVAASYEVR